MKRHFFTILCTFLLFSSSTLLAQTLILDFEAPATSDPFAVGNGAAFGGCSIIGVAADPVTPTNNVLEIYKTAPEVWAGVISGSAPALTIDLTTDHEICIDFYEQDASGTLLIKLENGNPAENWELQTSTTMGWGNYCFNTNTPGTGGNSGYVAAGNTYNAFAVFPDFGTCCTDQTYYFDNVYVNPLACDLTVSAGSATCDANTAGTDTYEATFPFSQTTAPGASTYTLTTMSGGTIGGDDPNTMTSGTITISGIMEGTDADLNVSDGASCDLDATVTSPACLLQFDITFQVNMCEQINAGTFDPMTQGVYVAGGPTYPACGAAMTDANMDDIYELTRPHDDGSTFNYKFLVGDIAWANTGACTGAGFETVPAPCAFGAFDDREYTVNGMDDTIAPVCLNSCTDCTTCNCDLMLLAGTASCDALTVTGTDTYEATITFSQTTAPGAGTYTLSTTSGGTIGGDDPDLMTSGTITISGIPEGTDADLNITAAGCDLNAAVIAPICLPSYEITFQVNMCERISAGTFDPTSQAVFVAGGPIYPQCGTAMTDTNGDSVYELTRTYLDTTTFNYKYLIGPIAWANTGNCTGAGFETNIPAACIFGEFNDRQFTVNGMNDMIPPICYGSCADCMTCSLPMVESCIDTLQVGNYNHLMDSTIQVEHVLTSNAEISSSSNVYYFAGSTICLDSDFEVNSGSEFVADIDGCCDEIIWYEDADGDGLGNPYVTITDCNQPTGYVSTPRFNTGYTTPTSYAGYSLVWSDEFDNNVLDASTWVHDLGDGCPNVCGWGNNEVIWYQQQNATVADDFLTIEAKEEMVNGYNHTSSRIKTQGNQSFQYGRIDIRAKLPYSQGLWPALWMLGDNITSLGWPSCGEIDIMELIGGGINDSVTHGTGHWDNNGHNFVGGSYTLNSGIFANQFHVFSIIWDATEIQWYVDDNLFYTLDITAPEMSEFHNPFFFIFNVSVGGNWPGYPDATSIFPQTMQVDYVRVFQ